MYQFLYLGFFQLEVKLGFEFPGVIPNQKYQRRSPNLNYDEESNPMLGSLKNSFSVESPNFPHQKLKMSGIEFSFNRNIELFKESCPMYSFSENSGGKLMEKDAPFNGELS